MDAEKSEKSIKYSDLEKRVNSVSKPAEYTKRTQYSFSLTYPTTDTNQVSNSVVFRIGWIGLGLVGIGCVLSQN